ncbi:---NA--- [Paramuricea clavata]|uniref:---NA n=1 Tax=Paramuricea clavata TaxID=317549 RepID=A0A6S7IXB9_PARCT|nr:---NA--- [Paramuricea clavata]
MATKEEPNSGKFIKICLKLSRETPPNKLKQLKFLLQDVTSEINDIHDQKLFLDLISKLEAQGILNRKAQGRNEALLLCELFDAVSLHSLADEICSEFAIERGIIHEHHIFVHFPTVYFGSMGNF